MKKFYVTMVALLVASVCFAQEFTPRPVHAYTPKYKASATPVLQKQARTAEETWVLYPQVVSDFWGGSPERDGYPLQIDSNGLIHPTTGAPWHPNFHSWSQVYDFNNEIYDEVAGEGGISFTNTASLRIDSISVLKGYFRNNINVNLVDTFILGILTDIPEDSLMQLVVSANETPLIKFYAIDYDAATGVQKNAVIFKYPLTAAHENVVDEQGFFTPDYIDMGINLNNITSKVWSIAYTFKRGYPVDVNADLDTMSTFTAFTLTDPRAGYYPWTTAGELIIFEDHLYNYNQGGLVMTDQAYNLGSPSDWDYGIYYPTALLPFEMVYPFMMVKIACDDCAYVGGGVGIQEVEAKKLTVRPNPASDNFVVELAGEGTAQIELYNLLGQNVYNESVNQTSATISVNGLKSGIYMLKVVQNNKVYTSKVVVK
ncbi:MAG: T9SS type A sorting domain-containing protein [Bacteroidales bacterium]